MEGETSKTYYFGQDNSLLSTLIPLLTQKGIDPSLLALINNDGFGNGNSWMWILFLLFLFGRGGYGLNGGGDNGTAFISSQLNNTSGRDMLLQAIQGNGAALGQLATNMSVSTNRISDAFSALMSAVQTASAQIGMSGLQTINAIQSGNAAVASQLAQCCCDNRLLTTQQGYEAQIRTLEQTNQLGSQADRNANSIISAINAQTVAMNDQFCSAKERDLQDKIDSLLIQNSTLRGQIDNAAQTAQITGYINSVVAPLQKEIADIAAKQPNTVPVQWPALTAVSTTPYYGGGFNPYGYGWGGNSYWG